MTATKCTLSSSPVRGNKSAPVSPHLLHVKRLSPPRSVSPRPGMRPSNSPNWRAKQPELLAPPSLGLRNAWASLQRSPSPQPSPQTRPRSLSAQPVHVQAMTPGRVAGRVAGRRHSDGSQKYAAAGRRLSYSPQPTGCGSHPPARKKSHRTPLRKLNPMAHEFQASADDSKNKNPLGGKLCVLSKKFFCEAYGLEGIARRSHGDVVQEAVKLTGCSERAIREVIYGHSYAAELQHLRHQVPSYPPKVRTKDRPAQLQDILDHPEKHPFCSFDGNKVAEPEHNTTEPQGTSDVSVPVHSSEIKPAPENGTATPNLVSAERVQGVMAGVAISVAAMIPLAVQALAY